MTLTLAPNALRLLFRPTRSIDRVVVLVAAVVAQDRRRTFQVVDHDVDVAIVVDVAECRAARYRRSRQRLARVRGDLCERAITIVVIEQLALAIGGFAAGLVRLRDRRAR